MQESLVVTGNHLPLSLTSTPLSLTSTSLISLMVFVDVRHYVYLGYLATDLLMMNACRDIETSCYYHIMRVLACSQVLFSAILLWRNRSRCVPKRSLLPQGWNTDSGQVQPQADGSLGGSAATFSRRSQHFSLSVWLEQRYWPGSGWTGCVFCKQSTQQCSRIMRFPSNFITTKTTTSTFSLSKHWHCAMEIAWNKMLAILQNVNSIDASLKATNPD